MYSVLLILINGAHQVSSFYCLSFGELASVTTAVSKALQAAATFISSSLIYCSVDSKQCMDIHKDIGVAVTCVGVIAYALDGWIQKTHRKKTLASRASVNGTYEGSEG